MTNQPTLAETVKVLRAWKEAACMGRSCQHSPLELDNALSRAIEVCERLQAQGAHPVSAPAGIDVGGWLRGVSDALAWARGDR